MQPSQSSKNILVIEDEQDLRDFYVQLLSSAGFRVAFAGDGEQGYELLKANSYDLVLLDMMLPKMTGLDILKRIQEEGSITTPGSIIILTNIDDTGTVAECISYGIIGYIVKSDTAPDKILQTVTNYFSQPSTS